jgi:hypothetical protein
MAGLLVFESAFIALHEAYGSYGTLCCARKSNRPEACNCAPSDAELRAKRSGTSSQPCRLCSATKRQHFSQASKRHSSWKPLEWAVRRHLRQLWADIANSDSPTGQPVSIAGLAYHG